MRILLIDPPYGFQQIGGKGQGFKHVLNKIPSLGLAYIAAVAEQKGHTFKIADCTLGLTERKLKEITEEFAPQIIGVSATTPTFRSAVQVSKLLGEILPAAIFVCGGAHPTVCPKEEGDHQ